MVQAAFDALRLDPGSVQCVENLMRDLFAADVRALFLVVMVWETIEAVLRMSQCCHATRANTTYS